MVSKLRDSECKNLAKAKLALAKAKRGHFEPVFWNDSFLNRVSHVFLNRCKSKIISCFCL